ncbi:hypothetical protein ACIBG4_19660 [Nonomuraea sp. NPDC050383]|uniref:hypothetical protein n=1 Tax=Nonomuraea sp. NPDC050383 TaxID=3364362 RepID=UPI0037B8A876
MQVEYGGPLNKPAQVRDSLRAFVTGLKSFGGLGVFSWEPEVYAPFATYGSGAWDPAPRPASCGPGRCRTSGVDGARWGQQRISRSARC